MLAKKKLIFSLVFGSFFLSSQNLFASSHPYSFCPPPSLIERNLKKIESRQLIDGFWKDNTGEVWEIDWAAGDVAMDKAGKIWDIDCNKNKKECDLPLQFQVAAAGYYDASAPKNLLILCDYGYSSKSLILSGVTITSHSFSLLLPPKNGKWKKDDECDGSDLFCCEVKEGGSIHDCPFIVKNAN